VGRSTPRSPCLSVSWRLCERPFLRGAFVLLTLAAFDGAVTSQTPAPAFSSHVLLEPNVGPWPSDVLFEARTRAGRVECPEDGFRFMRRSKQATVTVTLEGKS